MLVVWDCGGMCVVWSVALVHSMRRTLGVKRDCMALDPLSSNCLFATTTTTNLVELLCSFVSEGKLRTRRHAQV